MKCLTSRPFLKLPRAELCQNCGVHSPLAWSVRNLTVLRMNIRCKNGLRVVCQQPGFDSGGKRELSHKTRAWGKRGPQGLRGLTLGDFKT